MTSDMKTGPWTFCVINLITSMPCAAAMILSIRCMQEHCLGRSVKNGFIAWDDDADLAMSRDNLSKLLAAHDNDHPMFTLERQSLWVYRFSTKGAGDGEHGFLEHANTDIFVFDPAPQNRILFKAKIVGLLFLQASLKVKTTDLSRGFGLECCPFYPRNFRTPDQP